MSEQIDVFISYKREDYQRVDQVAAILREIGLSVWHDASLVSGDAWQVRIDEQAHACRAIVLCWTKAAGASKYVKHEAQIGAKRGVLLPVRFGPAKLPFAYRRLNFADMSDWNGEADHPGVRKLVGGIAKYVTSKPILSYLDEYVGGQSAAAVAALRQQLVKLARIRADPITYDQAKDLIARTYLNGKATPDRTLFGTLDGIAAQNRNAREPPLFGLVVLPETRIPGRGYFQKHCFIKDHTSELAKKVFEAQLEAVYTYDWPHDP